LGLADATRDEELHGIVEAKLIKVFGPERASALLRSVLPQMKLEKIETTDELARLAELLEARSGFEATIGTVLSVMAAVRRSQGR
jgi:hypothetical protein